MGCWGARAERVSSSVTNWPGFVFLGFFTSSSSPNRKSPSCLGEFRFRGWPAASSILSRRPSMMAPTLTEAFSRDSGSTRMPENSMSASTGSRGSSTVRNSFSMPLSLTCLFRTAESWRVISASSAEYLPITSTGTPLVSSSRFFAPGAAMSFSLIVEYCSKFSARTSIPCFMPGAIRA